MQYGFIGLGTIGRHLAGNLQRGGFPLIVHDISQNAAKSLLDLGAKWAESPAKVAEQCDTVITCLPSPGATQEVLADKDGILSGFADGGSWIEMGTLGRDEIQRFAALAAQQDVKTMEAPVTGGVHLAAHGEVTILAGGADPSHRDTDFGATRTLVPQARLVSLDHVGHFPELEDPARFVAELETFLTLEIHP